jgi:hypothetical protein
MTTTTATPIEVLLVAGGSSLSNVPTVYVPSHLASRPACRLPTVPSLPAALYSQSLDSVAGRPTVCGGLYSNGTASQTCLQLEGSSWRQVATLQERRSAHYSWLLPEGLLLLGSASCSAGFCLSRTTELAVATGDRQPGYRFTMDTRRSHDCSIVTKDGLVITGGHGDHYSRRVTRLSPAGRPTELPGWGPGGCSTGAGW